MDDAWGHDGPPAEMDDYQRSYVARNRQAKPKRTGQTPEAKVLKACMKYLEDLDCYVLRTSAGFTQFGERKMTVGRAGSADLTVCLPNGRYLACEVKAPGGRVSEAQQRQHEFIRRRGGIVIIPHSVDELRFDLVTAFGAQTVSDWEILGNARKR